MGDDRSIRPLIVSLQFDAATFTAVDRLRRQHFPPARNHLTAHLTLFHHLPGVEEREIVDRLAAVCESERRMRLLMPSLRLLGRGVAVEVNCRRLVELRGKLAASWQPWLTPQDCQRFRPHVTVQNKVDPSVARSLYDQMRPAWMPLEATGTGLLLWRYLGGPWEAAGSFPFGADGSQTVTGSTGDT